MPGFGEAGKVTLGLGPQRVGVKGVCSEAMFGAGGVPNIKGCAQNLTG